MSDTTKRIIDQTTDTSLSTGDYVMVDNETEGSKKYDLGSKLSSLDSEIGDLSELDTEVKTDLVSAINEAAQSGSEGLTDNERSLILTLFSKAAYAEDDAGDAYDQLSALWSVYSVTWSGSGYTHGNTSASARGGSTYVSTVTASGGHTISTVVATMGGVTVQGAWSNGTVTIPNVTGDIVITVTTIQAEVSSISAVYTQSGTVYETDTLDSLKTDLVVTATYVDQSTSVVPSTDYVLSGTLAEGTSTVTVSYGGKTDTFTVTVSEQKLPSGYKEYDYVELSDSGNSQGIIVPFAMSSDYTFETSIYYNKSSSTQAVFGTKNGGAGAKEFALFVTTSSGKLGYWMAGTDTTQNISVLVNAQVNTIKVQPVGVSSSYPNNVTININGTDYNTGSTSTGATFNQWLGVFNYAGSSSGFGMSSPAKGFRIGETIIKDGNGDVVCDLVPCTYSTFAGFYDTVAKAFYYDGNKAGSYTAGNWEA